MAITAIIKHGDFTTPTLVYGWQASEPETGWHSVSFELDSDTIAALPVKESDVSAYFEPHFGTSAKFYVTERPVIQDNAGVFRASFRAVGATDINNATYIGRTETRDIVASQQIGTTTQYQTRTQRLQIPVLDMHYFSATEPTGALGDTVTPPVPMPEPDQPDWATLESSSWKIVDRKQQFAGLVNTGTSLVPSMYYVVDTIRYTPVYTVSPTT
jgi:hypothetical protein